MLEQKIKSYRIKFSNANTFYCFSPPVMLATLAIETGLLLLILTKYRSTLLVKLAALTLFCLAGFQWAEYNVCTGTSLLTLNWSKVGFIFITLLPPLGVHMTHVIAKKKSILPKLAYALAGIWSVFFLLSPSVFDSTQCTGNYVIFQFDAMASYAYGLYYYGLLFVGMVASYNFSKSLANAKRSQALKEFMYGYLVFIVPTAIANTLRPETTDAIPSIMCGFAIVFALILALRVLPLALGEKSVDATIAKG